ncbi:tetratricopeptide repeat protein [Caballeronia sp. SL2Y3]|uniref:tetratricopeptide repeat protein n=1 Tax=Caballeronia sp. SL2Y3 TaxID=2878151 RepID=UPI001FD55BE3|nr:tetratricopeptide repeat protein [Caballeronia sp. SL2Y3]
MNSENSTHATSNDLSALELQFRRNLANAPDSPSAHNNLGLVLRQRGQMPEAVTLLRKAVALKPESADIAFNLGLVLLESRLFAEAETAFRHALARRPGFVQAGHLLGKTLMYLGRWVDGEETLREVIAAAPDTADAYYMLGNSLHMRDRLDEAEAVLRRGVSVDPASFEMRMEMGAVLQELNRLDAAEAEYRHALALRPDSVRARFALSSPLLKTGRYEEGFALYEARYVESQEWIDWTGRFAFEEQSRVPVAMWRGEPLDGKSLLIVPEQGLGDAIQFARFIPMLKSQGVRKLTVACSPSLVRLFRSISAADAVIDATAALRFDEYDYKCYMMSMAFRLGTRLDTIPRQIPYLSAPAARIEHWKQRLDADVQRGRYRVGLVWGGSSELGTVKHGPPEFHMDLRRSIRLTAFLPLLQTAGVTFVSLQKGPPESQLADIPDHLRPLNPMADAVDFAETAAIIENLDLVITVDTSVAHLAGALGKPVWILSRFEGEWRWLHERDDSPWYPSARIFRQKQRGEWGEVIERVARELCDIAGDRGTASR